ncbi:serine--tRNA ligase [Dictyobacter aurantiacus]|uniref:Serine--tRNA ligase n=1 Tax=Dictyobacter aurantiacus TaxID=1936993 RepID=A0A401ZAC9_9CHLR|nr:serine--tRNA ligase [Dictyobacter aurantiacus]GCE03809.1 serine--tRNA ligase [Dictyobacter aurantiacus]
MENVAVCGTKKRLKRLCYAILHYMLSLDFVCQHSDVVRDALQKRAETRNIDEILQLAEQHKSLVAQRDGLYMRLKQQREAVRALPTDRRTDLNKSIKALSEEISKLELDKADLDTRLQMLLLALPNLPHQSVPIGRPDSPDDIVLTWGEPANARHLHFELQPHWILAERLGLIDTDMGSRIAGNRFIVLKGHGARLERALISFMLDIHTREHGYTEIMPPQLARRSVMIGAGQLPKFEDQAYACSEDALYLNPTAEVPLVGMHSNSILAQEQLPLRYVAWTTAYRREAGSASRHTRGLLRLHQFNKIELFQYSEPQHSYIRLEHIRQHAETILQMLELPYRIVVLNCAHLPFAAAKTYDLEVWMPGIQEYIEVSSISNCEAFQARRANIKYRPENHARPGYVHTLNASGLAVGRTMAAILETYQQADGTIVVPKVLRPYMGASMLT